MSKQQALPGPMYGTPEHAEIFNRLWAAGPTWEWTYGGVHTLTRGELHSVIEHGKAATTERLMVEYRARQEPAGDGGGADESPNPARAQRVNRSVPGWSSRL